MKTYKFDCGCEFPILDEKIKEYDGLPSIDIDFSKISLTCKKTWELISSGETKGVFQLETDLGMSWASRLKPDNIEELSALSSLLRPGSLRAIVDGKSMTQHYVDRKFKKEEVSYIHNSLENIMKDTLGVMIYQEQATQIAKELGGFSLEEADLLRKATGKKDPVLMTKVEKMFIDGCKKIGVVNEEIAEKIFSWIRESQRYSFNKCLHPNTEVITESGKRETLENIKVGEKILCPAGYFKVVNKYYNGTKRLVRVTTKHGCQIICTLDHKFLCRDGYVRQLKDIFIEDFKIFMITNQNCKFEDNIKSIEEYGYEQTIDIEVDSPNHIFYGNNIAISNSHGVGYSYNTYWSAYVKYHFPQHFITAWLQLAHLKQDEETETSDLIFESKKLGIDVRKPSFKKANFQIENGGCRFGLTNIKDIGDKQTEKIIQLTEEKEKELGKTIDKWQWLEFLVSMYHINKKAFENMFMVGMMDHTNVSRKRMKYEFDIYCLLKDKEITLISNCYQNHKCLKDCLLEILDEVNEKRQIIVKDLIKSLEKPSYDLNDTVSYLISKETELLSAPLTYSKLDIALNKISDSTCKEIKDGKQKGVVSGEVVRCNEYIIKNGKSAGKTMAFLKIRDDTNELQISIFPEMYEKQKEKLYIGNIINVWVKNTEKGINAEKILEA